MRHLMAAGRRLGTRRAIIVTTLLAGAVLLVTVLMHGCGRNDAPEAQGAAQAAEAKATPVPVATALRTDIEDSLEVTGTAAASDEVDVVAEVAGKIARVYADVGDYVRRGSTLVRVDTQIAAAQRDQAAASVQSARASLNQAQEALQLTTATTDSTVRQAEVGVSAAQERLEQARASARRGNNLGVAVGPVTARMTSWRSSASSHRGSCSRSARPLSRTQSARTSASGS